MPAPHEVTIEVDSGVIICKEADGNLQAAQRDTIHWLGKGIQFTLGFATFPDGTPAWPFNEEPPTWPRPEFLGTLKAVQPPVYYKYSVAVVGCAHSLDPIIIVDK